MTQTLFFDIPDEGPYDLRAAWLRTCGLENFNHVVRNFAHTTKFGTFPSMCDGERIGTVVIRQLQIHDASVSPKYRVWFHLESGLQWCNIFECEIEDLIDQVYKKLAHTTLSPHENKIYLQQAVQLFESNFREAYDLTIPLKYADVRIGINFREAYDLTIPLKYANVRIGTTTIRRITDG